MKDPQNITISLLAITAAILTAMLVSAYVNTQEPAFADTPARAGAYIAVTGAWSGSRDLLYVTDVVANRLNVYTINTNTKSIEIAATVDLKRVFAAKGG